MVDYNSKIISGRLNFIDQLSPGDTAIGTCLQQYSSSINSSKNGLKWHRTIRAVENILFSNGRQYLDDIWANRLAKGQGDSLSLVKEAYQYIPKPTNDMLGRYIETNIALLTENRPRPRVTPKSDSSEDIEAAEISELTLEYLWEALGMPEKHREIARLLLCAGTCFLEIAFDPTVPRRVKVPELQEVPNTVIAPNGLPPITINVPRRIPKIDPASGKPIYEEQVQYGDINARVVSPFELTTPDVHEWNGEGMGWVLREYIIDIEAFKDKYTFDGKTKAGLTKANGWYLENLDSLKEEDVQTFPLWWWERVSTSVEGPGPSLYMGDKAAWNDCTIVRIFDRKPNKLWPRGRTIITAGNQLIYDSPKKIGARAYDPRWPDRWHPYIRFRWEAMPGSIMGRSLVSKLLPKLKRINAIDTTLIMWRRTVPMAAWSVPKGTTVTEGTWGGRPGQLFLYDPRRTAANKPEPIYPPEYPKTALEERAQQIQEMEMIAGTEQILRGERPIGTTSAAMIDILRKQALASRSATLQTWDECLQSEGSHMLQEVIKHIKDDPRYAERLRILSREKSSNLSIEKFSGADVSDNVQVRVDTASMALVSKEAREAKVIEIMQYLPAVMQIQDFSIKQAIFEELGLKQALIPQGPDVARAKKMVSWIKTGDYRYVIPYPEDDPYVFYETLINEKKKETFFDLAPQQQQLILALSDAYRRQIIAREQAMVQSQMAMAQATGRIPGPGSGNGNNQ